MLLKSFIVTILLSSNINIGTVDLVGAYKSLMTRLGSWR